MFSVDLPCIAQWLPIIGLDTHLEIPPIPPAPTKHLVLWWINGLGMDVAGKRADTVYSPMGKLVGRGYDAAFVLGHIPLGGFFLLPAVMLGSSSKCEFGASSVQIEDKGPVAVGLLFVVNPQLHCNVAWPMFTGVSLSFLNHKVRAGFSVADLFASIAAALYDIGVGWLLSKLYGKFSSWTTSLIGTVFFKLCSNVMAGFIFALIAVPILEEGYLPALFSILSGGPNGYAIKGAPYNMLTAKDGYLQRTFGVRLPNADDSYNFVHKLFD